MQTNKLTIMGLVTVVILVAAVIAVKKEGETVRNDQAGQYLFPDLKNKVNDVVELDVQYRDNKFSVKNVDGNWQVVEKNNYQAYLPKIKQVILVMSELTTIEPKTKRPDSYSKIGVEDPSDPRASSKQVTLKDKDGNILASLIVGKQQTTSLSVGAPEALYVRKPGEEQSWLVKGELHVDPKARDWLFTELFDVPSKRIRKVDLSKDGKHGLTIEKPNMTAKDFTLLNIPKKKEIESSSEVNAIAEGVSNLVIKDVMAAGGDNAVSFDKDVYHADFTTFDGLLISVDTVKQRGTHFAKFSAKYDAALRKEAEDEVAAAKAKAEAEKAKQANTKEAPPANPHTATPPPPQLKDAATMAKEAEELNKKFDGWIFEISSTKADNMRKSMDDLLKVSS